MPYRGSFNRRTGKTTPRHKGKTHWGAKRSAKRSSPAAKPAKSGAPSPAKK